MCDIWFTKHDNPNEGGYRRYMPVSATEDGIADTCAGRTNFYLLRVPGVPVSAAQKYFEPHLGGGPELEPPILARRRWVLRGSDLPAAARQKMQSQGFLTIKVGSYSGAYDYTWNQVRQYLRDNVTGLDESGNL